LEPDSPTAFEQPLSSKTGLSFVGLGVDPELDDDIPDGSGETVWPSPGPSRPHPDKNRTNNPTRQRSLHMGVQYRRSHPSRQELRTASRLLPSARRSDHHDIDHRRVDRIGRIRRDRVVRKVETECERKSVRRLVRRNRLEARRAVVDILLRIFGEMGSTQNGVTSSPWGSFDSSFYLVGKGGEKEMQRVAGAQDERAPQTTERPTHEISARTGTSPIEI
jgi:hypothetical protein